jgi:hypothetical protein
MTTRQVQDRSNKYSGRPEDSSALRIHGSLKIRCTSMNIIARRCMFKATKTAGPIKLDTSVQMCARITGPISNKVIFVHIKNTKVVTFLTRPIKN